MSLSAIPRMSSSTLSFGSITQFFIDTDNPGMRFMQVGLLLAAAIVLFLLFFALRDILLRTRSFWYQFLCIVIVTVLPGLGFLIYLLIRPARTIKQRELEAMLLTLMATEAPNQIEVGENEDVPSMKEEMIEEKEEELDDEEHDEDDSDVDPSHKSL